MPQNNVVYSQQRSNARTLPHRLPAHLQQRCQAHACDGRCVAPTTFCGHPNERCLRLASQTLPNRTQTVVTSRSEDALRNCDAAQSPAKTSQRSDVRNVNLDDFQDIRSSLLTSGNSTPSRATRALSTFKPISSNDGSKTQAFRFDEENFTTLQRPDVLQSTVSSP